MCNLYNPPGAPKETRDSESIVVTLKFTADEWARLRKWRDSSKTVDSMTGFLQSVVLETVSLVEADW